MYTIKFTRYIDVPTSVAWHIISDLEQYADYAPNLSWAKVIEGDGEGLVRHCADTRGGEWTESCVLWDECRQYAIQVDTSDYPYPFSFMQGTWGVEPVGNGSQVTMQFDFQFRLNIPLVTWVMYRTTMQPAFTRIGEKLLDNWESAMLEQSKSVAVA